MASVALHEKRGVYHAVWYDPTRRPPRIWRTLRTKDAGTARARLVQMEREHARGDFDPWTDRRTFERLTLQEAVRRYLRAHEFAPNTVRGKRSLFERLDLIVGGGSVTAIEPRHIEQLTDGMAASTANTTRASLRAFFTWLEGEGYIRDNPATAVRRRKEREVYREALTPAEVDRIISVGSALGTVRPYLPATITFMVATGLRVGEMAELRVDDCRRDRIHVGRSFQTKTGKGRTVPLFPRAQSALSELLDSSEHGRVVPVTDHTIYVAFRDWASHAFPRRGLSIHWLRHTFISWMANDLALPLPVVSKIAGHTNIATTMRYVHVSQDAVMEAIRRLHTTAEREPSPVAVWLSAAGFMYA